MTTPTGREHIGHGMKLHLRRLPADGRLWTVLSLRPDTRVRFSSNHFHDTWHVLGDARSARALAHLLWGLSFQRRPRTAVLIDAPHLGPTPFEAEPALPVLLVNTALGLPGAAACRALRRAARLHSTQTVRLNTRGLDPDDEGHLPRWRREALRERVARVGGLIRWEGCPEALRAQARAALRLDPRTAWGSDHFETEGWQGEVQVFRDFVAMASAARVAARELAASSRSASPLAADARREAIWRRARAVRAGVSRPSPPEGPWPG